MSTGTISAIPSLSELSELSRVSGLSRLVSDSVEMNAEAQGAWWFSRASNPLRVAERRPGWVRFPHASANKHKVNRKEGFS